MVLAVKLNYYPYLPSSFVIIFLKVTIYRNNIYYNISIVYMSNLEIDSLPRLV